MKKFMGVLTAIMLIATFLVAESNAQPNGKGKMGNSNAFKGSKFVDANVDGVCDNLGTVNGSMRGQGTKPNFVDADGDGVCDNLGTGTSTGAGKRNQGKNKPNFVDADGDGVCDNTGTGLMGTGKATSTGLGKKNQGKTRPNFVDADGDGICDYNQ